MLAKQSGVCPLCEKFIAKSQSHIERLPYPIAPLTIDGRSCAVNGKFYYWDGRAIGRQPRQWAHEACLPEFAGRVDLVSRMAQDWAAAGVPIEAFNTWRHAWMVNHASMGST